MKLYMYRETKEERKVMAKSVWTVIHNLEVTQNLAARYSCYTSFPFTIARSLRHSPGALPQVLSKHRTERRSLSRFTITA